MIEKKMQNGFDDINKKLYFRYINDEVEFGLFTNELIKKDTILGRWSGTV